MTLEFYVYPHGGGSARVVVCQVCGSTPWWPEVGGGFVEIDGDGERDLNGYLRVEVPVPAVL